MVHTIKRKGFALTEVLLAIAVIVVLGIISYPLYRNARTNSMVEQAANQMGILQAGTQKIYAGQNNYTGVNISQLVSAGLLPPDMIYTGTNVVVTPWNRTSTGGRYALVAVSAGLFSANSAFSIFIQDMPLNICTQLIPRVAPAFSAIGTSAGDGSIKGGTVSAPTSTINVANMSAACKAGKGRVYFTSR